MLRSSKRPLSFRFPNPHAFLLHPHATYPAHLIPLDIITRIILVTSTGHAAPHYAVLSRSPRYCKLLCSTYLPQQPVLKHLQPAFFSSCERPSFTVILNSRRSFNFVCTFIIIIITIIICRNTSVYCLDNQLDAQEIENRFSPPKSRPAQEPPNLSYEYLGLFARGLSRADRER
jgi:hypothetical protein